MTEERATQRASILRLLIASKGDWVSLLEIKERAPQYNARIFELRRLGFQIQNKIREIGGKRLSWFRLSNSPTKAAPATVAAPVSPDGEDSLFGDLAPRRYPD